MRRAAGSNWKVAAACLAALVVAGCGNAKKSGDKAAKAESVIYVSTEDCAAGGRLKPDECSKLFEAAIERHEKNAPKYKRLEDCEKAEGEGRCERTMAGTIHPRPMAFQVTFSSRPTAQVVYLALKGAAAFRTATGTAIDPKGDVEFTDRAREKLAHFTDRKNRRS
jgi:hypothetical protein